MSIIPHLQHLLLALSPHKITYIFILLEILDYAASNELMRETRVFTNGRTKTLSDIIRTWGSIAHYPQRIISSATTYSPTKESRTSATNLFSLYLSAQEPVYVIALIHPQFVLPTSTLSTAMRKQLDISTWAVHKIWHIQPHSQKRPCPIKR